MVTPGKLFIAVFCFIAMLVLLGVFVIVPDDTHWQSL